MQDQADKKAPNLRARAAVSYPVRVVHLYFSIMFCLFYIDHWQTFERLLHVRMMTDEKNEQEEKLYILSEVEISVVPIYDTLPVIM